MLVSKSLFLMILGFESGCLGLENDDGNGSIAKTNFIGTFFHDFGGSGDRFQI